MEDERLNETIRQTLIASRQPPEPPLDEMWQQIERRAFGDARRPLMLHARQLHWRVPALAAAAALAIGVGLGWYVAPRNVVTQIVASPTQSIARTSGTAATTTDHTSSTADTKHAANVQQLTSPEQSGDARAASVQNAPDAAVARFASRFNDVSGGSDMSRYLAQTAVLLASLPSDRAATASDSTVASRAGELLTQTHLLLDSQAGSDPTLHRLLEDLELVLAQVARLGGPRNGADLQLIHQALTAHDVLPRVHDATIEASTTD